MGTEHHVAAAVLAGGGSERMGRDKRGVVVEGVTLLERTLRALAEVAGAITLVGTDADVRVPAGADAIDARRWGATRVLPDVRHGAGPLAGLETALSAHPDAEAVLVVGVDHPWLDPAVLRSLVSGLQAAVARGEAVDAVMLVTDRGPQPLVAAYRPAAVRTVSALLDAGERRLRVVRDHLDVLALEPADWRVTDPFGATAVDVDTPEELARAVRWRERVEATRAVSDAPPGHDVGAAEVVRVAGGHTMPTSDRVIGEEPLELRAAGPGQDPVTLMTTLRTPGHEREQAAGWLLAEGLATPAEIVGMRFGDAIALARPDDTITVELTRPVDASAGAHRHAVATASCGVCGRASIDELAARTAPVAGDGFRTTPLPWAGLARLPDELRLAQRRFQATGGVHATGLFDRDGRLVTIREDVGRHNALDAAIGAHVLAGDWPAGGLDDLLCVLSGRIGFELVAKAAVARLPIVAAVGAASDLAVRTADRLGVTLVGFLRGGDGTVYCHPERLTLP